MQDNIFTATITESIPELGVAVLAPDHKCGNLYIGFFPCSDSSEGADVYEALAAGTEVACLTMPDNNRLVYILGKINTLTPVYEYGYGYRKNYNLERFSASSEDAQAFNRLLMKVLGASDRWLRNQADGVDGDVMPGDFDVHDKTGLAGLHIGEMVAQLKGSAMAFVDASGFDSRVRLVGDRVETHTVTGDAVSARTYSASGTAVSAGEAFGLCKGGAPMKDDNGFTVPSEPDAVPFYRIQHAEGAPVDGAEDVVLGFAEPPEAHTADTEPAVLARRRMSLSGELSDASALGIVSVKAPVIDCVHQLAYGKKPSEHVPASRSTEHIDDLRTPYDDPVQEPEQTAPEAPTPEDAVTDAALNKLLNGLLSSNYKQKVLDLMAASGFIVSDPEHAVGASMKRRPEKKATDSCMYPLPESIEITDPVSGEKKSYYATTSFISQEPDGSICICDGYGSEIRMSRGNIYISPALDLFLRPGRDISSMAGRHQSYNSQGACTINSADELYIRSVKDMRIGGATGGTGGVTLESGSRTAPADMAVIAGGNLSMTGGSDLYIGRNSGTSAAEDQATEPERPGAVVIDAGSRGSIYSHGGTFTADADTTVIGAVKQKATVMTIVPGRIGMYAREVHAPASITTQRLESGELTVCSGSTTKQVSLESAGARNLIMDGSALIGGNLQVNGSAQVVRACAAGSLGARSLGEDPKLKLDPVEVEPASAPDSGARSAELVKTAAGTVYRDRYVADRRFRFPYDYKVDREAIVPGMVWQTPENGEDRDSRRVWKEEYVKDMEDQNTACYPGYDIWEHAEVTGAGYKRGRLVDSYVTNTVDTEVVSDGNRN